MSSLEAIQAGSSSSWRPMLAAVPVRNAAAEVTETDAGEVSLAVAMKRPRWLVPPLSWAVRWHRKRTVKLDRLGSQLWALCDGERNVESVIDEFARNHRLSFHEARAAVTGYLKELVQRGVLAIAMEEA